MSRYWSEVAQGLSPYEPGEQPKLENLIKLNTNENPYGPSPRVLEALRLEAADSLRLYPDPASDRLRVAIAEFHGVKPEQIFVGNGSDEVLAHAFLALLKHEQPVLFPDITYSFYPVYCSLYGVAYRPIPLTESFEIRVDDYFTENGGIVFPNPNAPTGRLLSVSQIERLLSANADSVVLIDEAYIDFGGVSAIPLVDRYPQLLVVHTLSKSHSLAGLRVGYAVGNKELIDGLVRVKDSFNSYPLDRFAQAGAVASMQDGDYCAQMCRKVMVTREWLTDALRGLGFDVVPSAANFVFTRHPKQDAAKLTASLRERGIIVRHFKRPESIVQHIRITVGTAAQCTALVTALKEILA
ncbi:MAG: histidinol-phosphate transaminase [Thiobacillaceae bacterium]